MELIFVAQNSRWSTREVMLRPDDRFPELSVNLPELLTRVDNDHELLRDLLGIFKKQFPRLLQSLHQAVVREDMKLVEAAGHTLRGMLANLEATRAAASAARLERMGKHGVTEGLREELATLEGETALALAELETFCREMIR